MQRRRRPKAAPKNIFGGSSTKESKKKSTQRKRPPMAKPVLKQSPTTKPPVITKTTIVEPDSTVDDSPVETNEAASSDSVSNESAVIESENLVESQILGSTAERKSIGLKKEVLSDDSDTDSSEIKPDKTTKTVSERAAELIESSMERAAIKEEERVTEIKKSKKLLESPAPVVKKPRPRSRQSNSYQPAERARRLDRSRHMEYKYEMKGLLSEIDVSEEHRSNISATVWARGERKTASEAKDFLREKCDEGAIDESQLAKLSRIIDDYTIRR